jgi:hydrogenase 3 maturation protease
VVDFKINFKGKILILGVGNPLKQDDGAGPYFIQKFKEQGRDQIELLDAGLAPENYTGKIKQIKPDTLIIVDAVDLGSAPGTVRVLSADDIAVQGFSTHNVSLKTFVGFLKEDLPELEVAVVGIQPKKTDLGEGLSPEVRKAVDELCTNLV